MGCISSKKEIDDIYPNVFQVMNVDEQGNRINPGQLEITDVDLVLYQHGKPPIKWPLRTLRRYGFDSEHFSFESGRRCQTGPGIYAFRCRRAEQLFNLLQSRIQIRNNGEAGDGGENPSSRETGYLEPTSIRRGPGSRFSSQNGITRMGSATSASGSLGPLSPQSVTSQSFALDNNTFNPASRPLSQNLYANEDIIASAIQNVEETNNNKTADELVSSPVGTTYLNVTATDGSSHKDVNCNGDTSNPSEGNHLYMNILPGVGNVVPRSSVSRVDWESEEPVHNYANFDAELGLACKPPSPTTSQPARKLNYIVLDLDPCSDPPKPSTGPPDSPGKLTGGYAAIDFKKTVALSHSVNPNFDNDSESSRKTRHNSTINDLIAYEA